MPLFAKPNKAQISQRIRPLERVVHSVRRRFRSKPDRVSSRISKRSLTGGAAILGGLISLLAAVVASNRLANAWQTRKSSLPKPQGLDLAHFTGPWYEVAFLSAKAQPRYGVRIEIQRPDARTLRLHESWQTAPEGKVQQGTALLRLNQADSGRWYRQQALGLLEQPEWLLELGEQHSYAVLGTPGRQQLRILSRLPALDAETYAGILERMQAQGFDTQQIQTVAQPEQAPAPLYAHLQALQQQKRAHYRNGSQTQQQGPDAAQRQGWRKDNGTV